MKLMPLPGKSRIYQPQKQRLYSMTIIRRDSLSLPRYIESHDMGESTKAEVHYTTKDAQGVYTIKDLRIDEKDETKVKCTWLLSQNVTKTPGAIRFLLRFSCIDAEGNIEYAWNTAPFVGIVVTEGIYNTEAIVEQYADVLEQLKNEVVKDLGIISSSELDKITEPGIYVYGGTFNDYYLLSVYTDVENGIYRQRKFDLEGTMIREGYSTQSGKIEWSDWSHNGGFDDIPFKLSDLEDDLKIQENIDKKLDKGWTKLGEEVITEQDIKAETNKGNKGVDVIEVDCGDLSWVSELRINLKCGVNSINGSGDMQYRVFVLTDTTEKLLSGVNMLFNNSGATSANLRKGSLNNITIDSYFMDGIHQYSIAVNTNYNSHCYVTQPAVTTPSYFYDLVAHNQSYTDGKPVNLKDPGRSFIRFLPGNNEEKFYFPAGAKLTVYAR